MARALSASSRRLALPRLDPVPRGSADFHAAAAASDPVAACRIIHWDNYVPFDCPGCRRRFRDGESLRGDPVRVDPAEHRAVCTAGALAETAWRIRRMRRPGRARRRVSLARSIPPPRPGVGGDPAPPSPASSELTQYTGLFGIVPCTYRVSRASTASSANTLGTYAGVRLLPFMARNSRFMGA